MARRFAFLGVMIVLSQLCSGCWWHRCGWWRWHCYPASCSPAFSHPMAGAPVAGPESCPSCYGSGDPGVAYSPPRIAPVTGYPAPGSAGPGVPIISGPMPLYPGPRVEPIPPAGGGGIPNPMPPGKSGN